MKPRIIQGIALATARLIPRLAQNSPAEIKVCVPFVWDLGLRKDYRLIRWLHNIRQYMSYKIAKNLLATTKYWMNLSVGSINLSGLSEPAPTPASVTT